MTRKQNNMDKICYDEEYNEDGACMKMVHARKAQITVFMIIGIILLFSSALLFYIRAQVTEQIGQEFIPETTEVPLEAQPVKMYVEGCLEQVGKAAVKLAALHGGYIDPKDRTYSGMDFLVGIEPTESDALMLFSGNNALIPYWWYLSSSNDCSDNCQLDSLRPQLSKQSGDEYSIESQIDRYVANNIGKCIDGFKTFKSQGMEVVAVGEPKADTMVTENDVAIILEYPITLTQEGKKTDISRYFVRLDVDFKDIYTLASELMQTETQAHYLEGHIMNMITMYSKPTSMKKLPPIAEFKIGLDDYMIWTRTETQKKIENNVLMTGMSQLKVNGTRSIWSEAGQIGKFMINSDGSGGYEPDAVSQGMYDRSTVFLLDNDTTQILFPKLQVDFIYLDWWPIYLNINDQEVLKPESANGMSILSAFGVNYYRFWYSVSFPVLVRIKDYEAFNGEGITFLFALEGNIRDNNYTSSNYVSMAGEQGTKLSCNENQKNSGEFDIETVDALTKGPVFARVDYVLGSQACVIGFTALDKENKTTLKSPLPVGFGLLKVTNESYLPFTERMITRLEEGENKTVELMPYAFVNATVFVKRLVFDQYSGRYVIPAAAAPSSMSPITESAIVQMKRLDDDGYSSQTVNLIADSSLGSIEVQLVPGTYEVKGYLLYNKTIFIPATDVELGGGIFGSSEPVHLNATTLDSWTEGGIILNNETGLLTITMDQAFSGKKLVIYLLGFPLPQTTSTAFENAPSLEQLAELEKYSNIYRTELEPQWI